MEKVETSYILKVDFFFNLTDKKRHATGFRYVYLYRRPGLYQTLYAKLNGTFKL